jgi:hypothetical protein
LMTRSFGLSWFYGGSIHAKFLKPVLASETVSIEGAVCGVAPGPDGAVIEVEFWIRREDASIAAVGWAIGTVRHQSTCA